VESNKEQDRQLQTPLPVPASLIPLAIGDMPAIDDMLMTRAGSWLVEFLAKRGVNPTVTGRPGQRVAWKKEGKNEP
jgi:hypothetical protein